eukprot:CAMPEP_0118864734 /NCGR_PEP_ID=MMETSP1163-20130328/9228_1 /TAXON_ID=124430 /ORGANISM="Phaeomonas parva, Strain CCMP2877" /LENGTH=153 /DNA_ID=CAMNT_0006798891 /DNA_START=30 /DNA_END=491 /DNA_ORIENTATION=+
MMMRAGLQLLLAPLALALLLAAVPGRAWVAPLPLAQSAVLSVALLGFGGGGNERFEGAYADPFHPLCERRIRVEGDRALFSGTDVGPKGMEERAGCSAEEVERLKLRQWAFEGTIRGNVVDVGDGVHNGKWESNGIRWNDGNKWTKQQGQGSP